MKFWETRFPQISFLGVEGMCSEAALSGRAAWPGKSIAANAGWPRCG